MIPVFGYFHIEASNPIVGLWCDDCQLPSLCEFPLYSVTRDGVGQVGTVKCCVECSGDEEGDNGEDGEAGPADLVRS